MDEQTLLDAIEKEGITYAENKADYDYHKKCLDIELEDIKNELALVEYKASEATLKRKAIITKRYKDYLKKVLDLQKTYLVAEAKLRRLITYKEFRNGQNQLAIAKINKGVDL